MVAIVTTLPFGVDFGDGVYLGLMELRTEDAKAFAEELGPCRDIVFGCLAFSLGGSVVIRQHAASVDSGTDYGNSYEHFAVPVPIEDAHKERNAATDVVVPHFTLSGSQVWQRNVESDYAEIKPPVYLNCRVIGVASCETESCLY